jgi:hypothetical protein
MTCDYCKCRDDDMWIDDNEILCSGCNINVPLDEIIGENYHYFESKRNDIKNAIFILEEN